MSLLNEKAPEGFVLIEDEEYVVRCGDLIIRANGAHEIVNGFKGRRVSTIRKDFSEYHRFSTFWKLKDNPIKIGILEIPINMELVTDDNYILTGEEFVIYHYNQNWLDPLPAHWKGKITKNVKYNYGPPQIFKLKKEPITAEQKKQLQIKEAHNFIDEYVRNPSKEDIQRFELVFQREDDFGL